MSSSTSSADHAGHPGAAPGDRVLPVPEGHARHPGRHAAPGAATRPRRRVRPARSATRAAPTRSAEELDADRSGPRQLRRRNRCRAMFLRNSRIAEGRTKEARSSLRWKTTGSSATASPLAPRREHDLGVDEPVVALQLQRLVGRAGQPLRLAVDVPDPARAEQQGEGEVVDAWRSRAGTARRSGRSAGPSSRRRPSPASAGTSSARRRWGSGRRRRSRPGSRRRRRRGRCACPTPSRPACPRSPCERCRRGPSRTPRRRCPWGPGDPTTGSPRAAARTRRPPPPAARREDR